MAKRIWPAVKLAANRIPNAKGREIWLATSINTSNGDKASGAPLGIKLLQNVLRWSQKPYPIILDQTLNATPKVIIICVVGGKVNKKNPIKFNPNKKKNNAIMPGEKDFPWLPKFSDNTFIQWSTIIYQIKLNR